MRKKPNRPSLPSRSNKLNRPMTPTERENARDVAIIRREIAKGGRTHSHAQVMKELGYHDLA